jgi:hypothetical protein
MEELSVMLTAALYEGVRSASTPTCHFTMRKGATSNDLKVQGPQRKSGRYGKENNLLPLLGIEPQLLSTLS